MIKCYTTKTVKNKSVKELLRTNDAVKIHLVNKVLNETDSKKLKKITDDLN